MNDFLAGIGGYFQDMKGIGTLLIFYVVAVVVSFFQYWIFCGPIVLFVRWRKRVADREK